MVKTGWIVEKKTANWMCSACVGPDPRTRLAVSNIPPSLHNNSVTHRGGKGGGGGG